MTRLIIDIGSNANDGTGDTLRAAMEKINTNFVELYNETAVDSGITISGNNISANRTNDDIKLIASGTGDVTANKILIDSNIQISDNKITTTVTNSNLELDAAGTGSVSIDSISFKDNTISTNISNANLELGGNGSGTVEVNGFAFPTTDGSSGQFLKTNGSGVLSFATAGVSLDHSNILDGTATVATSTTSNIDTFDKTLYRSAKYFISATDTTNGRYETVEANVTHNGTTAYVSTFGSVSSYTDSLGVYTADIDGDNVRIRVTPISNNSTVFKFVKILMDV